MCAQRLCSSAIQLRNVWSAGEGASFAVDVDAFFETGRGGIAAMACTRETNLLQSQRVLHAGQGLSAVLL